MDITDLVSRGASGAEESNDITVGILELFLRP
jgi:hypothetical protein